MSDVLIAGIFLGVNAVAGVNLITPVYSFASFCGLMFSLGVPILLPASAVVPSPLVRGELLKIMTL